MRLKTLVDVSNEVAAVPGRLEKTRRLSELLQAVPPDELEIAISFLSGSPRQGRIGIRWSSIPALDVALGGPELVPGLAMDADQSDPGPVAASPVDVAIPFAGSPANQDLTFQASPGDHPLELRDVDRVFERIQRTVGAGSSRARTQLLTDLFGRASVTEWDFLARLLAGELRQGALEGILVEAVARAAAIPSATIRQAAMAAGQLAAVARVALTEGAGGLAAFQVQLFRPVQPMLAESASSIAEALETVGEAAFEFKLDGARIQAHRDRDQVRVFSRNLRDVTAAVPEVVEAIRSLPARSLILDGEVIALRPDGGPHPFQETMRRFTRKLDVNRLREELPLTPFVFDCLYADGEPLLDQPQSSRFARLMAVAPHLVVPHVVTSEREAAERFLAESLERGHEGVMAKAVTGRYVAGSRGRAWLKIKTVRTLDLVVLAAEWGHGRRRGWLSNLHLGARRVDDEGFVMLGKTFKGLTDQMLEWQTHALLALEERREGHVVYVRPELVVEVAFNDIQVSPQYPGKLALRFARVKGYRPDKTAAETDTLGTLREIYRRLTGREPPG